MTELPMPDLTITDSPTAAAPGAERPTTEPPLAGPSPADPVAAAPPTTEAPAFGQAAPPADGASKKRLDRRARRTQAAALRDASFDWLAKGFTHQEIAAARKVSVAVVRRDIAKAIRARQIETRDGHAQLQIARLTKGLAVVAHRIERGDMAAVGPLVKLVTALDRYHGPGRAPAQRPPISLAPREAPVALPAPPLAIAHVATPEAQDAAPDAGDEFAAAFGERLD